MSEDFECNKKCFCYFSIFDLEKLGYPKSQLINYTNNFQTYKDLWTFIKKVDSKVSKLSEISEEKEKKIEKIAAQMLNKT